MLEIIKLSNFIFFYLIAYILLIFAIISILIINLHYHCHLLHLLHHYFMHQNQINRPRCLVLLHQLNHRHYLGLLHRIDRHCLELLHQIDRHCLEIQH